jgi:maleylacetoacetate isomerase
MTGPVLFDYYRSSASYRVRIALNLKGVEYRSVPVDLAAGRRKRRSSARSTRRGSCRCWRMADGGSRRASRLSTISTRPARSRRSFPADAADRAHVVALALTIACDIHPLNNLRVLKHLTGELGLSEEVRNEWIARWISEGFAGLEALAAPRAGRFLFGDNPTLADICLVPQMYNARRFNVPLDAFPLLVRVDAEATAIEAIAAAHPDRVAPPA